MGLFSNYSTRYSTGMPVFGQHGDDGRYAGSDEVDVKALALASPANCFRAKISGETDEDLAEFRSLLNSSDVKPLRVYLRKHCLSPSNEYQLIVFLGMELANEGLAERILCSYIRWHGLCSEKSVQLMKNLGFWNALQTWSDAQEVDESVEEEPSALEKLCDGFVKFCDEDVVNGNVHAIYQSVFPNA